jgi:hypothetical protein
MGTARKGELFLPVLISPTKNILSLRSWAVTDNRFFLNRLTLWGSCVRLPSIARKSRCCSIVAFRELIQTQPSEDLTKESTLCRF